MIVGCQKHHRKMESRKTTCENISSDKGNAYENIPSRQVQFWTYLIFQIPSLACILFLLAHLLLNRRLRRALNNHVIIILLFLCLVVELIDNSLYLDGWRVGGRNSFAPSSTVCLVWWFIDYGFYGATSVFLAWASFERHILIFHQRKLLNTRCKTIFLHYIPLIILSIYLIGFYIDVIFYPPCENTFDFESISCGSYPCYQEVSWLAAWDYLMNGIVSILFETLCSITLLIRIIWKKHHSNRPGQWRKSRKMAIQMLSLSILSISINLPQSLIILIQNICPDMANFGSQIEPYFFYLTGYVVLFLPFVCLGSFTELWPKLIFFRLHRQTMNPSTIAIGAINSITVRPRRT